MRRFTTFCAVSLLLSNAAHAAPHRAEIVRDDWGIAHISGRSDADADADAKFKMIYAQAEDDFNRIDMNYLTSLMSTC